MICIKDAMNSLGVGGGEGGAGGQWAPEWKQGQWKMQIAELCIIRLLIIFTEKQTYSAQTIDAQRGNRTICLRPIFLFV